MKNKSIKSILGLLVVALVAFYFWRALSRNWDQVRTLDFSITPEVLIATVLFASAVLTSGWLWGLVFARVSDRQVSTREAIRSHLGAWLLKYIPGQVGAYVYKLQWGKKQGASKVASTLAFAYETLFLTLASTVLVIPILLLAPGEAISSSWIIIYVLCLALILAVSKKSLSQAILAFLRRVSGKKISDVYVLSLNEVVRFTGYFTISRIINAVGFVVLASSILPVTANMYAPLGAAYILAGIVGIYAFMVPSGLGVREAVIVLFASTYFTTEEAIVLSLLARLYATVADGIVAIIYSYMTGRNSKEAEVKVL